MASVAQTEIAKTYYVCSSLRCTGRKANWFAIFVASSLRSDFCSRFASLSGRARKIIFSQAETESINGVYSQVCTPRTEMLFPEDRYSAISFIVAMDTPSARRGQWPFTSIEVAQLFPCSFE